MAYFKIEIKAEYGGLYSDYNGEPLTKELAQELAQELCDDVWKRLGCDADVTIEKCEEVSYE